MKTITITKPDDWHLHLRDSPVTKMVLPYTVRQFEKALIMPNLKPPVTNAKMALDYRDRILSVLPKGMSFDLKMTIYLTDKTTPEIIREAFKSKHILAAKLYPANATTNSKDGVTNIWNLNEVFRTMEEVGMVLCIHGELLLDGDEEVDIFDREKFFLDDVMSHLVNKYENLKIVLEHITTADAVDFVENARDGVVATITAHHLLENRNALFRSGICPHNYCLPILKRKEDKKALVGAATSGSPRFFAGTDSAPHAQDDKESACGCAGCFTAPTAVELYAETFDRAGALDEFEPFLSFHGADFYGLPRNTGTITLVNRPWIIPQNLPYTLGNSIVPFWSGRTLNWRMKP